MEKENTIVKDNHGNSIDVKELLRKYPWKKQIDRFLSWNYQIGPVCSMIGVVNVYCILQGFAGYLTVYQIIYPTVIDVVNFFSTVMMTLLDIEKSAPIVCDFVSHCQCNKDTLFGGALKDVDFPPVLTNEGHYIYHYQVAAIMAEEASHE